MKHAFLLSLSLLFLHFSGFSQIPEMTENTNTIMSNILLNEMKLMDYDNIEKAILDTWDIRKEEIDGNNQTISFKADSVTILVAMIPVPLPGDGLETAVEYANIWKDARSALNNKSHISIAVIGEKDMQDLYVEATKIAAILLKYSDSSGIFLSNQSLLLSRGFYLEEAEKMTASHLPIKLWAYIGLRQTDQGNSAYTYGLKEFGLPEIEIVNSPKPVAEVSAYLCQIAQAALLNDTSIPTIESVDLEDGTNVKLSLSNGVNVDGKTVKVNY